MGIYIKDNFKMVKEKAKENKYMKMEIFTKDNFWMINNMEKEKKIIKIMEFILDNIFKELKVVKVLLIFLMGLYMTVNLKMMTLKEQENKHIKMGQFIKEIYNKA